MVRPGFLSDDQTCPDLLAELVLFHGVHVSPGDLATGKLLVRSRRGPGNRYVCSCVILGAISVMLLRGSTGNCSQSNRRGTVLLINFCDTTSPSKRPAKCASNNP